MILLKERKGTKNLPPGGTDKEIFTSLGVRGASSSVHHLPVPFKKACGQGMGYIQGGDGTR